MTFWDAGFENEQIIRRERCKVGTFSCESSNTMQHVNLHKVWAPGFKSVAGEGIGFVLGWGWHLHWDNYALAQLM